METNDFSIELRQAGSELLMECASTNVVAFGNMSGHLKGKTVPGENIRSVKGTFPAGAPLILLKGTKVGPGIALVSSDELRDAERAVKIKDLNNVSAMPISPDSDREDFVRANKGHLKGIERNAASEIRKFIEGRKEPIIFLRVDDPAAAVKAFKDAKMPVVTMKDL